MITYTKQSIFQIPAQVYCNPVNCKGISGAGLALQFRQRYPDMYETYRHSCNNNVLCTGGVCVWTNTCAGENDPRYVWCVATMSDPGHRATSGVIKRCVMSIFELLDIYREITSIAVPALGCGIGKFSFGTFKDMIESGYDDFTNKARDYERTVVDLTVCEPR